MFVCKSINQLWYTLIIFKICQPNDIWFVSPSVNTSMEHIWFLLKDIEFSIWFTNQWSSSTLRFNVCNILVIYVLRFFLMLFNLSLCFAQLCLHIQGKKTSFKIIFDPLEKDLTKYWTYHNRHTIIVFLSSIAGCK